MFQSLRHLVREVLGQVRAVFALSCGRPQPSVAVGGPHKLGTFDHKALLFRSSEPDGVVTDHLVLGVPSILLDLLPPVSKGSLALCPRLQRQRNSARDEVLRLPRLDVLARDSQHGLLRVGTQKVVVR